ncbi:hypothetical protein IWW57_000448 [Coemansia sp. S610]|nr:hypothetical protein IWW57_000448 [Coemansia sp. S610]
MFIRKTIRVAAKAARVTLAAAKASLAALNRSLRKLNADATSTDAAFPSAVADVGVISTPAVANADVISTPVVADADVAPAASSTDAAPAVADATSVIVDAASTPAVADATTDAVAAATSKLVVAAAALAAATTAMDAATSALTDTAPLPAAAADLTLADNPCDWSDEQLVSPQCREYNRVQLIKLDQSDKFIACDAIYSLSYWAEGLPLFADDISAIWYMCRLSQRLNENGVRATPASLLMSSAYLYRPSGLEIDKLPMLLDRFYATHSPMTAVQ